MRRFRKALLSAALVSVCAMAHAQLVPNWQISNEEFITEHALAYIPKASFAIKLLDMTCPRFNAKYTGNVAFIERNGIIALSGCYVINQNGDVNVTWENGATRYYRRESVRKTLLGMRYEND